MTTINVPYFIVDEFGHVTNAANKQLIFNNATSSAAGLMSANDKQKIDGIEAGANKITVDSALSSTSTNPVQNKIVNSALSSKVATVKVGNTAYTPTNGIVSLPAYPTTLPASDVYAWAKAPTKPDYDLSEIEETSIYKRWTKDLKDKLESIAWGAEVNVQSDWNATSGDALILNKPAIGNGTITIQQNNKTIGSFTLNQSSNAIINLADNDTTYGAATAENLGLVQIDTTYLTINNGLLGVDINKIVEEVKKNLPSIGVSCGTSAPTSSTSGTVYVQYK